MLYNSYTMILGRSYDSYRMVKGWMDIGIL